MKTLLTAIAFVVIVSSCSTPEQKIDPLVLSIDSVAKSFVDTARFNGNVLVARNGEVIYKKSFGRSNFYTAEDLNDSTLFELASVSKAFTAMSIMMLKEDGKLSYDDDARKYLPGIKYEGITIRHLLTHTSGLTDYGDVFKKDGWDFKKIAFNNDMMKAFERQQPKLDFQPGEKWEYSNTAYVMLAVIVERVSKTSFEKFLEENIFTPLDMKRSRVYNTRRSGEKIDNYAYGFVYSDSLQKYVLPDSLKEYFYVYTLDGITGDGIVNTTTGDLFKWNEALYTDKLVSKASIEEAFTPGSLRNDSTHNYGFGWFVMNDSINGKIVRHSGGWPGYSTQFIRMIDHKDCIIVLNNTDNWKATSGLGKELAKVLGETR